MKSLKSLAAASALAVFASPLAAWADVDFDCDVIRVIERSNRIGVNCSNSIAVGADTVEFITYAKTDVAAMDRFTKMATAAMLSRKKFHVELPESSAGNVSGCEASNCRTVTFPFAIDY